MAWAFHSFTQLSTPPENKWMDEWIKNKEFATLETKRVPGAEMRLAIERFHMTSRRLHCYSKTMKRWPCWFPKPTPWQLKSFLMETLSFVPINVHRCSLLGTCRSAIGQFFVLTFNFITLFDLPQNTNNDKTRQLHKSKWKWRGSPKRNNEAYRHWVPSE